jgi:cyclopropane fatty-acyl-phospholipid synthase-like methyltransferase
MTKNYYHSFNYSKTGSYPFMPAKNPLLMPTVINSHLANVYPALSMMAGMQLEIFTAIGHSGITIDATAKKLNVQPLKLRPLLYALVSANLLTVEEPLFYNTAEANEFLVKGKKRYIGSMHSAYSDLWSATMHTADSIRQGSPIAEHNFSKMTHDELRSFVTGLDAGASASARRLHKEFDMNRFQTLLDAGGGSGGLAIALSKLCPKIKITVGELGNVAPITKECIESEGLGEIIRAIEIDLTSYQPSSSFDAIVLRSVLQVMSPEDARSTMQNATKALNPNGEIFMLGRMLDDSRLSPKEAVAVNVMFLNVYPSGQAYTESEYRSFFLEAGLENIQRKQISGGYSILHANKKG